MNSNSPTRMLKNSARPAWRPGNLLDEIDRQKPPKRLHENVERLEARSRNPTIHVRKNTTEGKRNRRVEIRRRRTAKRQAERFKRKNPN